MPALEAKSIHIVVGTRRLVATVSLVCSSCFISPVIVHFVKIGQSTWQWDRRLSSGHSNVHAFCTAFCTIFCPQSKWKVTEGGTYKLLLLSMHTRKTTLSFGTSESARHFHTWQSRVLSNPDRVKALSSIGSLHGLRCWCQFPSQSETRESVKCSRSQSTRRICSPKHLSQKFLYTKMKILWVLACTHTHTHIMHTRLKTVCPLFQTLSMINSESVIVMYRVWNKQTSELTYRQNKKHLMKSFGPA